MVINIKDKVAVCFVGDHGSSPFEIGDSLVVEDYKAIYTTVWHEANNYTHPITIGLAHFSHWYITLLDDITDFLSYNHIYMLSFSLHHLSFLAYSTFLLLLA